MDANAKYHRHEPWSPFVKTDEPPKPTCFGDVRRAQIIATQILPPDGKALAPSHETSLIERWTDRQARRRAERAGTVVEPPKRHKAGGRQIAAPLAVRKAVRAAWPVYSTVAIARHHGLSQDTVRRICADLVGRKPRCGRHDLRPAPAAAARRHSSKPIGRCIGSRKPKAHHGRSKRRGESRAVPARSRVKDCRQRRKCRGISSL
jgi:hypothetical protein